MADNGLEVEVKFQVPDLQAMRERIIAAGGTAKRARIYERNVRYDTLDGALLARYALLRLRQDTRAILTYKGIPESLDLTNSEVRVREELEVEVSDFKQAELILRRLGFHAAQVYEKYRETLQLDEVEIVLDELPFGNFIELEGSDTNIRATADRLGLDWTTRILTNYLSLLEQVNAHYGWRINDLTFDNFAGRAVEWPAVRPGFAS